MVFCCVPNCGADSWKSDGSITFYDFPYKPDLAAKWIRQINTAIKTRPMWFPRGKPVICSKHFLHTDFRGDTDSLKPGSVPTVFGHKYIGPNAESNTTSSSNENKTSPLIVVIKPQDGTIQNDSNCISERKSHAEVMEIQDNTMDETFQSSSSAFVEDDLQTLPHKNNSNNHHISKNATSYVKVTNEKPNSANIHQHNNTAIKVNGIKLNHTSKGNSNKFPNLTPKKVIKKNQNNGLIEIGPNTFLKINPDIIKVNKKQTPSGNTVIQFLMDQKLVNSCSGDLLPKLIQVNQTSSVQKNNCDVTVTESTDNSTKKGTDSNNQETETVQHVLGHIVDTHACEEACADLHSNDEDIIEDNEMSNEHNNDDDLADDTDISFIEKAPVLLQTNMPVSHCFIDKPKYVLQLKQKNRQITSLKLKTTALIKKIEELEDRCIVQEKQLSYSFIKRLKSIRKNASKGDPRATYILEQIRGYSNNSKMRWSDTTLTQCATWCRKAPYAYEYFKKAGFFKLPCLGSVKRFIKKHPEFKFQNKIAKCPQDGGEGGGEDDDDESSDFDFDESDVQNDTNHMSEDEINENVNCEVILSDPSEVKKNDKKETSEIKTATQSITNNSSGSSIQKNVSKDTIVVKSVENSTPIESNAIPITVDSSNLELQEIILPTGEVVQCYSSIGSNTDIGGQYYIIPNVGEQNNSGDHEYSVIQADSLPVVLQNLETSQLHLQQDQLIFIANSSDQVECTETEVTSA